ncbi:AfsR/SARP family transcriptional regulator [Dactylosporangium darangshiense]|uniref:AfsR/SARP family transcriptional regulator n=1 Tax=Dactylosporangium darangshiense TaxID=579108 RepID=UPI0031ECA940
MTALKQRAVLATLLLDPNREVSVEHLNRYVWDGKPPAAAHSTLPSYIYRLRQIMRPIPGVKLTTGVLGYTLHLDESSTDLGGFRALVIEARAALDGGDAPAAVACLRAALSLWRGNALSGVPGNLLHQEGRFLESERVAAYEELFAAEMALGNTRKIIPELLKIVSLYPFHESFRAQLMLGLYRCGRQAEALQNFAFIRRKLADELGIEPGVELRELQKVILDQVPPERVTLPSRAA